MRVSRLLTALVLNLLLVACGGGGSSSSGSGSGDTSPPPPAIVANFDPANSIMPFPSDLLFSGSTDLTLNIPVDDPDDFSDPKVALNALDGFSTVAAWSTVFSNAPDQDSLKPGEDVHLYQVTLDGPGGKVTGITRELSSPSEYVVTMASSDATGKTLVIKPTQALKPRTSYMAVLTNGIVDGNGAAVTSSLTYTLAKGTAALCVEGKSSNDSLTDAQACALEPVRQRVNAQESAAAEAGVTRANIVLSWVATTQSTAKVLQAMANKIEMDTAAPTHFSFVKTELSAVGFGGPDRMYDIYTGYIRLPYYLGVPGTADSTAPLTDFWHAAPGAYVAPADSFGLDPASTNVTAYNPIPIATTTVGAPLLVTLPSWAGHNAEPRPKPSKGWPVVIFQHGLGGNRTDMLALAQAFFMQGYAVIAMDLPLHGVLPGEPYYIGDSPFAAVAQERTFNVDYINGFGDGADGIDGQPDPSGAYFINVNSLLTSRDNLREGVVDLVELEHAIGSMDVDGKPGPDLDPNRISFVGQALGAMVGTAFMAVDPNVHTAVLNVPGGGIARLLDGSAELGPKLHNALSQAGIEPDTLAYARFMVAAQTALDSGDPINFAHAVSGKNLLLQEVVGDDTSPPDQVIPNSINGAPLSGTEPLISALGLSAIDSSTQSDSGIRAATRFIRGVHGSLLFTPGPPPSGEADPTSEMQSEMTSLITNNGHEVQILHPDVLKPADQGSSDQ